MAEPTPFLPPFFPLPAISSFWGTSIAITTSKTQEILLILVERKHWIRSFLVTSSPSMTLTYLLFSITPLTLAPLLTFPLLLLLSPYHAPGRCFRTWILITYQFFYLSPSLSDLLLQQASTFPSICKKLAGMTLPFLTLTVFLQRNTHLFSFPLLLLSLLL